MEVDDSAAWEFNAPQFVDFTQPLAEDHSVEEYFDFDHENDSQDVFGNSPSLFPKSDGNESSNTPKTPRRNTPRKNTPQRNTPQGKTPQRLSKTNSPLTVTALKDSNALTPRRSNRIKQGHTPKAESRLVKDTSEKENAGVDQKATPTGKSAPTCTQDTASESRVPANICTSVEEWNRKKGAQSAPGQSQKPGQKSAPAKNPASLPATKSQDRKLEQMGKPVLNMQKRRSRQTSVGSGSAPTSPVLKKLKRSNSALTVAQKVPRPRQASLERPRKHSLDKQSSERGGKSSLERTTRAQTASVGRSRTQSIDRNQSVPSHQRSLSASRHTRSHSTGRHSRSMDNQRRSVTDKEKEPKKPKLTIPVTPAVLRRDNSVPVNQKTSEQRQLEEIKRLRSELALKRKKADESHKMALTAGGYVPVRSGQAPTKMTAFHFATDDRVKNPAGDAGKDCHEQNFTARLRHHSPTKSAATKMTVPVPFNLHEDKKRKRGREEDDPAHGHETRYKSMAEQLKAFTSKTPDRFRMKPTHKETSPTKKKKSCEQKLTVPRTPNLDTRGRTRAGHVVSQAELDDKEVEEIKKYKFKANPVNDKIFRSTTSGVPKVPPKEITHFDSFELQTDRRIKDRTSNKSASEEHYEFHANPVPKQILEGVVGVKPATHIPLTKPASPAFALKERLRAFRPQLEESIQSKAAGPRAKPVPHLGLPFLPKLEHKVTHAQPFSFETRDRTTTRKKEEKIQKIYDDEKKMREFHANPLPSDSPDSLPQKRARALTEQRPFQFEVDQRGTLRAEEWEMKVEEELRNQRQAAAFKAKPALALYKQPFMPKKSTKGLTDHQDFELSTERRQERWSELEKYRHQKELEADLQQREIERRKKEVEEEEVKRLRQTAVHRAKGIRQYKTVDIKPSHMPLTQPETPRFSQRLKSRFQKS